MSHKNTKAVLNLKALSFRSGLSSHFNVPAHSFTSLGGQVVGVRSVIVGWLMCTV